MEENVEKTTSNDINFIEVFNKIWQKRKFILLIISLFAITGLILGILSPNQYTASSIVVPQIGEKRAAGGISGLAAIAGINIGSLGSGDILSPNIYPFIINNINFKKELIYSKFYFENAKDSITFYDYSCNPKYKNFNFLKLIYKYTIGLPGLINNKLKGNKYIVNNNIQTINPINEATFLENQAFKKISSYLSINYNNKDGYIIISAITNHPKLSAEIVYTVQKLLQKYVTNFKLEKVRHNLEFVELSYNEAKKNFQEKQIELANYRDANKNLSSEIAKTNEEKLTSEYNLLFELYTEISKQKEQAKIAITETTPIFTIVQPVVIPSEKSGPKRMLILFGFIISGLIFSIVWTLYKEEFAKIYKIITNK
jgi:uncharacterized protein involved in exopolysaccharide biosynthesis